MNVVSVCAVVCGSSLLLAAVPRGAMGQFLFLTTCGPRGDNRKTHAPRRVCVVDRGLANSPRRLHAASSDKSASSAPESGLTPTRNLLLKKVSPDRSDGYARWSRLACSPRKVHAVLSSPRGVCAASYMVLHGASCTIAAPARRAPAAARARCCDTRGA